MRTIRTRAPRTTITTGSGRRSIGGAVAAAGLATLIVTGSAGAAFAYGPEPSTQPAHSTPTGTGITSPASSTAPARSTAPASSQPATAAAASAASTGSSSLAFTGADIEVPIVAGAVAIIGGGLLVGGARRRRHA